MSELEMLAKIIPLLPLRDDVQVGAGDDAAVLCMGDNLLLAASDQLIGDVHFFLNSTPANKAGEKLLKRNLSDIAAMGGTPLWALTNVATSLDIQWVVEFNHGIAQYASENQIAVVGGDLASLNGENMVASLTILGTVQPEKLCLRSNAKVGELILVTGELGKSLESEHHLNFTPRLAESAFLAGTFTSCMMDISDGLALDAKRLASASNVQVALDLEQLPARDNATLKAMLSDGEDYELLFTLAPEKLELLLKQWPFDTKLSVIGEVRNGASGTLTNWNNQSICEDYHGFEHFKK